MSTEAAREPSQVFQHNPYSKNVLAGRGVEDGGAEAEFFLAARYLSENELSAQQKDTEMRDAYEQTTHTECENGISDNSTEETGQAFTASQAPAVNVIMPPIITQHLIRFASVNFRFGSAWFVAPFRTAIGEMVVVEYPHNNSLHVGLVSCISTQIPHTFASMVSFDGTISEENLQLCPRILRHARDFDKQTKLELRAHDLASLNSARELALEMQAPVTLLDAEWLLDLTAVTFLVNVWGDMTQVDRLADELAALEGSEVVFTYPAVI